MNFGQAIEALKKGENVTRLSWKGRNMHIGLQVPDDFLDLHGRIQSVNTLPYIWVKLTSGRVPWVASNADLLADDWAVTR